MSDETQTPAPVTAAELDDLEDRSYSTALHGNDRKLLRRCVAELRDARARLAAIDAAAQGGVVESIMRKVEVVARDYHDWCISERRGSSGRSKYHLDERYDAKMQAVHNLVATLVARAEKHIYDLGENDRKRDRWEAIERIRARYETRDRDVIPQDELLSYVGVLLEECEWARGSLWSWASEASAERARAERAERIIAKYAKLRPPTMADWGKQDYDTITAACAMTGPDWRALERAALEEVSAHEDSLELEIASSMVFVLRDLGFAELTVNERWRLTDKGRERLAALREEDRNR